ncbi:hypothetical protein [Luteimonas sp. MC1750]|uniref:hypothetical protein n=1 Tax=Luteimonas sp. MC1750 TaxID=2799326 RepID=UPI0018F05D6D|nr:hypothetical protein [Luteimonas sp. MC1750]MBJ6983999.1 hypothetical protein [Luteimonas sp. MC1750]QQO06811.1 hypothetical protein JGR68_05135 [Luteimonas sp. MC1750]
MSTIEDLKTRSYEAMSVLAETYKAVANLEVRIDERTATTVPLVLASLDMADAIYVLLATRPERAWVAALALQRSQMEYVLRAAFFAKAASQAELMRFRTKGKMPNRGKNAIYIKQVAEEAAEHMGWEKEHLVRTVVVHQKDLSSAVHGGREVLGVYTQREEWGDIEVPWDELGHHIGNVLVFVQLGLGVVMSHCRLDPQQQDQIARPAFESAHAHFDKWGAK